MAKPQKFKGNQATYRITFEGIGVVIENVMFKEVAQGEGQPWAMLDQNRDRWKMLSTPGYLIEPLSDEVQYITFDRSVEGAPKLVNAYAELLPVKVNTRLNFGEDRLYSIDECPLGTRLQYSTAMLNGHEHCQITRIIFEKVSK